MAGLLAGASLFLAPQPALAHPHVFIDGQVNFVFNDGPHLKALEVHWSYDEFETLYILALLGISLTKDGSVAEADRLKLLEDRSNWPSDFDGSAHLSFNEQAVALNWPSDLDVEVTDGRIKISFIRTLQTPLDLAGQTAEVALYESTYFFAFKLAETSQFIGQASGCSAAVAHFDPSPDDKALQSVLAALSREETPQDSNVGALFADRIMVECA